MTDRVDARMAKLHVMAALLGIPVDSFFGGHAAAERCGEVSECLRLWDKIKTADGHHQALEYLRELADEPKT